MTDVRGRTPQMDLLNSKLAKYYPDYCKKLNPGDFKADPVTGLCTFDLAFLKQAHENSPTESVNLFYVLIRSDVDGSMLLKFTEQDKPKQ